MTCWQIEFKDISSVPADPDGKQQHLGEALNIIDMGTSVLLDVHVRPDFTAETALEALASTLTRSGRPERIALDRDPRWVGSPAGSDFPAALIRFGANLGIEIHNRVGLPLDADLYSMQVIHEQQVIKALPIRGLVGQELSFEQFGVPMQRQARFRSLQERRYRSAARISP